MKGVGLGLLVMYAIAAFVNANPFWFDGMLTTWSSGDRAFLLWWCFVCGVCGWAWTNRHRWFGSRK